MLQAVLSPPKGFLALSTPYGDYWLSVGLPEGLRACCEAFGYRGGLSLGAVGTQEKSFRRLADAQALWVRTESKRSQELLSRFRPKPTLIVREGQTVRCTAFWALREGLSTERTFGGEMSPVENANRQLAHALGCPKKHCNPWFRFTPPDTIDRSGKKPVPVHVMWEGDGLYEAAEVVSHLAAAPDPNAWREAA